MSNKNSYLPIRIKSTLRQQLEKTGNELEFVKPNGKVNLSRVLRYLIMIGLREETNLTLEELIDLCF